MSESATVVFSKSSLKVRLPMTQPTGKVRIKRRSFFSDYGIPVASRSEALDLNCYIEWQIGYDLLASTENSRKTTLSHLTFSNYKKDLKFAYELSEIVYYSFKLGLINKQDLLETYNEIKSVRDDDLIDVIDEMRIFRTVVRQICCPFVLQIKCLLCLRNNTSCVTLFVPTSSHYTKRESNLQIKYRQDSLERLDEFTVADCLHHDIGIDQVSFITITD